ncbi:MAG: TonB-dependent receptor plug domain-containing protein [Bacteroidales bacterium]|nr:TonB-dependent receptor plug domain-containing protein [Bacteroidales bacterium]
MRNFVLPLILSLLCAEAIAQEAATDTTLTLKESIVSASVRPNAYGTGSITIPAGMLKDTPALLGDPDLIKTLQLLPGIQAASEGLSGMIVRGGGPDENLILLDGVEVYGQGHILGLFSPFQSEAVGEAVIHKGAFPARLGGRASSVLEIHSAQPAASSGSVGIGPLSDKADFQGRSARRNISYSVSGRGTHTLLMDGVFRAFKMPANFHFHDLHARASKLINHNNTLSVSYFSSKDNLYYKEDGSKTDISWGSSMGSASWRKGWNQSLSSDFILAYSGYSTGMGYRAAGMKRESLRTGLDDLIAKTDFRADGIRGHTLRFGAETIRHIFTPESETTRENKGKTIIKGLESAVYIEDEYHPDIWLTISSGLRMTLFRSGGALRLTPEPRISVTASLPSKINTMLSWSRVSQNLHQLSSPAAALPVDLIVPVTDKISPVLSDQISIGLGYHGIRSLEISAEAYWKMSRNVLEYKDDILFIYDFEEWEDEVAAGLGRSVGIEFLLRKTSGKTKGWLGYTLSKNERRFQDAAISGGEWFPWRHDSRHKISAVLNESLGNGWDTGATWTYSSGGAVSVPQPDGSIPRRGNLRLPPSHRLDLGVNHHKERRKGEAVWGFGVYNAYNRKNPNIVLSVQGDEEDSPDPVKTISFLPIIPSVSYTRVF